MKTSERQRLEVKQLALALAFIAVGLVLSFIELPIMPGTLFLKYDASDVAAVIAGFTFGPAAGCLVGIVVTSVHALFSNDLVGAMMNVCVMAVFVLPPTFYYKYRATTQRVVAGLAMGVILAVGAAILLNMMILPYWPGLPLETVVSMIPTTLLPFNIIKMTLNAILSFIFWKILRRPLNI